MSIRRFRILLIAIFLLVSCSSGIFASATPLAVDLLPLFQQYMITTITPEGDEEYSNSVSFLIQPELNQVLVNTTGSDYLTKSIYDLKLQLLSSDMRVVDQADAIRVGFDQRFAEFFPADERIDIKYILENEVQDERELFLKDFGIEMEVAGLALQNLLLQGETEFHGQLIDINGAGRYNLDSKVLSATEISKLADGRQMAPQVRDMLSKPDDIIVFSIGYDGMLRWFFPVRFHVILAKEAPHHVLAFWGGSGNLLRYQIYQLQK